MNPHIEIDRTTNVAYFDVEDAAEDAVIRVQSVSEVLGLKSEILARFDIKNKKFLGLVIEDYKAFSREIRIKYLAFRVERLIDLLMYRVRSAFTIESSSHGSHLLLITR